MENKKMKLLAKSLAKDMIRRDMKKWPPDCLGLTYQPMRPCGTTNWTAKQKRIGIQKIPIRDFPHLVACKVQLPIFQKNPAA